MSPEKHKKALLVKNHIFKVQAIIHDTAEEILSLATHRGTVRDFELLKK